VNVDTALRRAPSSIDCVECGGPAHLYMVSDALWLRVMPVRRENSLGYSVLCLQCLEKLAGRRLTLNDFPRAIPANEPIHFGFEIALRAVTFNDWPRVGLPARP